MLRLCADNLRLMDRPLTPTYLMWQMMNELTDEMLDEMDYTLVDVAEEVQQYCDGQ